MLYMSISGFFANAACGPKAHSGTAPAFGAPPAANALAQIGIILPLLLILAACPADIIARLDNPLDPKAPSYQGYPTVANADEIEAVTEDGIELVFQHFVISEVLGAEAYHLQISASEIFDGELLYDEDGLTSNAMTGGAVMTPGKTYYWRGRAKKDGKWGLWTEVRGFFVDRNQRGFEPVDGSSTTDTTPTLSWDPEPGTEGYEVQIADSEDGGETASKQSTSDSSYTVATALTNLQTYHWRVRTKDGNGQFGAWSAFMSLSVNWGVVSGLSPADGASTTDTTPTFSWTAVTGADKYEVRIADSTVGLDSMTAHEETGISYTPSTALTNNQTHYWQVRAVDGEGQAGTWSTAHSLQVNIGAVSGLSPAITTDTTPTLSWNAVAGAVRYEVRIADSMVGLDSTTAHEVTASNYTPSTSLTNLQTHYWQVRAKDGNGQFGAWSTAHSLQVNWGAVSGLSPADGASTTDITPEFSWSAVAGATRYEIQIADSAADLSGNPTVDDKNVPGTSYTPTTALTNQQLHHWRVRAVDGDGQPGNWSRTQELNVNFEAVSGLNPTNGSSTTDITPEFSWSAVAGATRYEIQIADSAADLSGNPTVDDKNVPGTSYTPTTALTNQQLHHWRVRAVDGDGQPGNWSRTQELNVNFEAVSGLNPTNGSSTTDITPEFSWSAVAGATRYEIQIADSAADLESNPTVNDKNVPGTSYTPTTALTNLQLHHWRVRAVDGDGQPGNWSRTQELNVNFEAVSGLNPTNGSSTTDITPEFSWSAVAGATRYEIQIADSAADLSGNPTVDDKNVPGTSYTPTTALTNQQLHHWRVRAVDGDGQPGNWSRTQELNVNFEAVSGLNPTNGSSTTDITPEFSWSAVAGATRYEIQIADSAADLSGNPTVNDKNVPGTSYTPTTALTNLQLHHWRVRAVDGEGQPGAWSGTQELNVNFETVSGLNPTDGSSTTNTKPTLRWNAVTGASSYEIQIADSAANLAGSSTADAPGASYTPTTALTNKQTHHWRVRAVDGDGQFGAWSGASSLRVEWGTVSGLNPANGSITTDTTPAFSWNAVAGAAKYQIQIADSEETLEGSPLVDEEVSGTSYTPASALTDNYYQTYHWRVRAMDANGQTGDWHPYSFSILGTGPAGGIVFYDKGYYSDGWRYLEAATSDQGSYQWGGYGTTIGGTQTGIGSGKANTEKIVAKLGDNGGTDYAAKICAELDLGGKDDWFLPSKDELYALYKQRVAVGGFSSDSRWSSSASSEYNSALAWIQFFGSGYHGDILRSDVGMVRAVRAF